MDCHTCIFPITLDLSIVVIKILPIIHKNHLFEVLFKESSTNTIIILYEVIFCLALDLDFFFHEK